MLGTELSAAHYGRVLINKGSKQTLKGLSHDIGGILQRVTIYGLVGGDDLF